MCTVFWHRSGDRRFERYPHLKGPRDEQLDAPAPELAPAPDVDMVKPERSLWMS